MKILMTTTASGSIDGIRVTTYDAGTEYDLTGGIGERDLAAAFVGAGFATEVGAAPVAPADAAPVLPAAVAEVVRDLPPVKAPKALKPRK